MVEGTYEKTTARVMVGEGASEEFGVKIGLRQGSVLRGEGNESGDSFVNLGGAVCGDGKTEREVRRRVQAGANAWRAVEGGDGGPAELKKTRGQALV